MIKYKETFNQKFTIREVRVKLDYKDDEIEISSDSLSKNALRELADELVNSGYTERVDVVKGIVTLINPDYWMCGLYDLQEVLTLKLEDMGFSPSFLS